MVKVTWTDLAEHDLLEIESYIAQDSPTYAIITVEKIFLRTSILEKHPNAGRIYLKKFLFTPPRNFFSYLPSRSALAKQGEKVMR